MSGIIIEDAALHPTHYLEGKPTRYTYRIGHIELIVWLTDRLNGQWRYFVRKTAYMQPLDKYDKKLMDEFTSIGIKAINHLNRNQL